jgi:hypothetical protein
MKTRHYFPTLSCTFLLIAGIAACEKNPNTEVKSAQTELTSEQRKAQQDEAELRQKQANERAENRNADVEEQAELRRKQQGERTETAAEGQIATSDAQRDVTHAREKMAQDRRDFGTKSSERLVKLDSRAQEMTRSRSSTRAMRAT